MKTFLPVFFFLVSAVSICAQEKPVSTAAPVMDAAAQKNIIKKLNQIIIPALSFQEARAIDAIGFLKAKSVELDRNPDPAMRGIGDISVKLGGDLKPRATPNGVMSPGNTKITLSLRNISLGDVLYYIALLGHLKITFDSHGMVIEPLPAGVEQKESPLAPGLQGDNSNTTYKLNHTIIPKLEFRDATVRDAVEFLRIKSAELDPTESDPARKGVNIILVPGPTPAPGVTPPFEKKISLSLTKIPLSEVFRYIDELAGLKLTVDPHAVLIQPMPK